MGNCVFFVMFLMLTILFPKKTNSKTQMSKTWVGYTQLMNIFVKLSVHFTRGMSHLLSICRTFKNKPFGKAAGQQAGWKMQVEQIALLDSLRTVPILESV